MDIYDILKKDKNGIPYLTQKDIKINEIYIPRIRQPYKYNSTFYGIEGIDNYIIKDSTMYPYFNNRIRHLRLLKGLIERQKLFDDIEFPIGYYLSHILMKGTIIPYYLNYPSLRYIVNMCTFDELKKYYDCESDPIDNLISLFLEILYKVIELFSKGVYYIDVNTSNFLIFNNIIKAIDFEPGFVYFEGNIAHFMKKALIKYECMINYVLKKFGFKDVKFTRGEDFYTTELNVLALKEELERSLWNLKEKRY